MPNNHIALFKYSLLFVFSFTFLFNFAQIDEDSLQENETDSTIITDIVEESTASEDTVSSDNDKTLKIYHFEIHSEIGPSTARICEQSIEEAEEMNADYLLLDLDTYGGYVDAADEMRTALLNTDIPAMVFIRNNAASAGAFISIACDSIYMSPTSTIGACAVVDGEGNMAPEKYQSYMRGEMRSTAEANNRNPLIAEGMVDPTVIIEGVTDSTEIITFTTSEAIANGYCEGEAKDIEEVLELANIENYEIVKHEISYTEKIISWLVNPAVSGVLLMIIIAGIYFELQTPGVGFPLGAAFIAAMLYFMPHYLEGLAANWEIALFVIGLVLLALEVFVIPGFGVAGISGIILVISALILSLVKNIDGFDFTFVPSHEITYAFLIVSIVMVTSLFVLLFGSSRLADSKAFARLKLDATQSKADGYVISAAISEEKMVGREGIVVADLRPAGKIAIDGKWHDAQSDGDYIEKDNEIIVKRVHGAYLIVAKKPKA